MSNQAGVQAAIRASTGTEYDYNGDWSALFDANGIASGDWNGRMLAWINSSLGTSYADLPGAQQAFAVSQGFINWSAMNSLTLSGASDMLTGETDGIAIDFTDLSMVVKDTTTPANAFSGSPLSKLTYTAPAAKLVRNASGVLVSDTTMRIEYDINGDEIGLLVEPQRTNLQLHSADFSNAVWNKSAATVTANAAVAPDGTTTADTFVESTSTGTHEIFSSGATISLTAGTTYTISAYVKPAGRNDVQFYLYGPTNYTARGYFTLTGAGSVRSALAGTCAITQEANGWYRIVIVGAAPDTGAGYLFFGLMDGANVSYTGNGTSGVHLWGAQCEAGTGVTSYIATTTSTVSRAADNITLTAGLFPTSATAGTMFEQSVPSTGGSAQGAPAFALGNYYYLGLGSGSKRAYLYTTVYVFGNFSGGALTNGKNAMGWAQDDAAAYANGSSYGTDISGTPTDTSGLTFYVGRDAGTIFAGHIKKILYLPRRMSNAELGALTT